MEFQNSRSLLILGDPSGYHIRMGQDIPPPLNADATIKAVLIFAKDGDDYGYVALRDFGGSDVAMEHGFVIAGVRVDAEGVMIMTEAGIGMTRALTLLAGLELLGGDIALNYAGGDITFLEDDAAFVDQSANVAAGWATTGGYLHARRKGQVVTVRWNLIRTGAALAANVLTNIISVLDAKYRPELDMDFTGAGGNISTGTYGRTAVFPSGTTSILAHAGFAVNQRSSGCVTYLSPIP